MVAVSLCRGNLWEHIKFLYLRQKMCLGHSEADNQHAQWLLEIGAISTMNVRAIGHKTPEESLVDIIDCNYDTTHLQENPQRLG